MVQPCVLYMAGTGPYIRLYPAGRLDDGLLAKCHLLNQVHHKLIAHGVVRSHAGTQPSKQTQGHRNVKLLLTS